MFLIAHRGNRTGKNPGRENSPSYIQEALSENFHVEVDVWWHENHFWLGHDKPKYRLPHDSNLLQHKKVWCHAKNLEAVRSLVMGFNGGLHWFWHETDKITMTSKGYIWAFPKVEVPNSIINQPENIVQAYESKPLGICADDFSEIISLIND